MVQVAGASACDFPLEVNLGDQVSTDANRPHYPVLPSGK